MPGATLKVPAARKVRYRTWLCLLLSLVLIGWSAGTAEAASSPAPPAGQKAYLFAPQFGTNLISAFDLETHDQVAAIGLEGRAACCAYTRADGNKVFVVDGLDANVTTIDVNRMAVEHKTPLSFIGDRGADIREGGLFWASTLAGSVEAIDSETYANVRQCHGVGNVVSTSPDGRWLYTVSLTDLIVPKLDVRSAETCNVVATLRMPRVAAHQVTPGAATLLSSSPDGRKLYAQYLAGEPGLLQPGFVQSVDVSDPRRPRYLTAIPIGTSPLIGAFTPDGRQLWIPNSGDGSVTVIDVATDTVVHTVETGRYVTNVEFWHDRAYLSLADEFYPPPTGLTSLAVSNLTLGVLGSLTAPPSGQRTTRPGIDVPGEIIAYDLHTYQRRGDLAVMKTPTPSFVMEVASPASDGASGKE
jgi:YVTN family beta-propeller protein